MRKNGKVKEEKELYRYLYVQATEIESEVYSIFLNTSYRFTWY